MNLSLGTKTPFVKRSSIEDEEPTTTSVAISNLEKEVESSELRRFFGQYGPVLDAQVIIDPRSGVSKGIGSVVFSKTSIQTSREIAKRAIKDADGFDFSDTGRLMRVKIDKGDKRASAFTESQFTADKTSDTAELIRSAEQQNPVWISSSVFKSQSATLPRASASQSELSKVTAIKSNVSRDQDSDVDPDVDENGHHIFVGKKIQNRTVSLDGGTTWMYDKSTTRRMPVWDDLKKQWLHPGKLESNGEDQAPSSALTGRAGEILKLLRAPTVKLTGKSITKILKANHNHGDAWLPKSKVVDFAPNPGDDDRVEDLKIMLRTLELDSRPGSRRSTGTVRKKKEPLPPAEFIKEEQDCIWGCGNNTHGELGVGTEEDTLILCPWPARCLERHAIHGRVSSVICGWYHGMLVVAARWKAPLPPNVSYSELMDESRYSIDSLAELLLEWASYEFKSTARDGGLPESAHELAKGCSRDELVSMYLKMVNSDQHGSLSSLPGIFCWGMNQSGQLGLGNDVHRHMLTPMVELAGRRVAQVACGGYHTLLLLEDQALLAFGDNRKGQLGLGTRESESRPCLVPALSPSLARQQHGATCPSPVVLITNLNSFVSEYDVRIRLEEQWGFRKMKFRNADRSTVSLGNVPRPTVLAYFKDEVCAAAAKHELDGQFLNDKLLDDRLRVFFWHGKGQGMLQGVFGPSDHIPCLLGASERVFMLACGFDHSIALLSDGKVVCWGGNRFGQLGVPVGRGLDPELVLKMKLTMDPEDAVELKPVFMPFTLPAPLDHDAGNLRQSTVGKVFRGLFGAMPNLSSAKRLPPPPPPPPVPRVRKVVCGGNHTMLLLEGGGLFACGRNDFGQLGLGPFFGEEQRVPAEVKTYGWGPVRTVVCGAAHSFALLRDGRVMGWGRNDCGQLGLPLQQRVKTPTVIVSLAGRTILHISTSEHTVITCNDNECLSFGLNSKGQLCTADPSLIRADGGKGAASPATHVPCAIQGLPEGVRISLVSGSFHTLALARMPMASGAHLHEECAFACGYNKHGELGLGFLTPAVDENAVGCKVPVMVAGLHMRGVRILVCGWYHTIFIEDDASGGKAWAFGYNKHGQLGQGHLRSQGCSVEVPSLHSWAARRVVWAACGGYTSFFGDDCDEVWGCGSNRRGALGLGPGAGLRVHSAARIAGLCHVGIVGMACGFDHCFAIASGGGGVYAFGGNEFGQLGLGTTAECWTPTLVRGLGGLSGDLQIRCGGNHSVAFARGERVLACGRNDHGQCGLGHHDHVSSFTPLEVVNRLPRGQRVEEAACGASHSLFIIGSGELTGCGRNDAGQLGLRDRPTVSRPALLLSVRDLESVGAGTRVVQVAAGEHTVAVLSCGMVVACGCNSGGQLGVGTTADAPEFVQTPLDGRGARVYAGAFHTLVRYEGRWMGPIPPPPPPARK